MKAGAQALIPPLAGLGLHRQPLEHAGHGLDRRLPRAVGLPHRRFVADLLDGEAIDVSQAFTMLTGSRLGASFVVLVVGFIYALRQKGKEPAGPDVDRGPLAHDDVVAYLPGALIGWLLLTGGHLDGVNLVPPPGLLSVTDTAFGWAVDLAKDLVPVGSLPGRPRVLLLAFKTFDAALPQVGSERIEHRADAWYTKPWAMFPSAAASPSSPCRCRWPSPSSCRWWPRAT